MKRILVTGSSGFIGFHVSVRLLKMGYCVIGIDNHNSYYDVSLKESRKNLLEKYSKFHFYHCDIISLEEIERVFNSHSFDGVIHLAGQAGVQLSLHKYDAYIQSNILGFTNVIDLVRKYNVGIFCYASSSSIYGKCSPPFTVNQSSDSPISMYAITKKTNELIAYSYHHLYGISTVGLRLFTVYGPYGRPDMSYMIFAHQISNDQPINVYGDPSKIKRSFSYIDDIVLGIVQSLELKGNHVLNLGGSECNTLLDMIHQLESGLGKTAKIIEKSERSGDMIITDADISETIQVLDWYPKTSFEKGMQNFCFWYKKVISKNSKIFHRAVQKLGNF